MKNYLKTYLFNKPFFYIFIRPKEADLFVKFLPFKKPVMDYGCGDGFFAKMFYPGLVDVGVDIRKNELRIAGKRKIYKKRIFYNQERLPFRSNYFATIFANCVLEHVDNLDHDLKEINRVLQKGGMFIGGVMTDKWESFLIGGKVFGNVYKNWMRRIQNHPNLLSVNEWDEKFKNAGFKVRKRIGYLDEKTSRHLEVFHFFSIGSLITHKLFGRWVIFPQRYVFFPRKNFFKIFNKEVNPKDSAAVFYVLEKI